MPFDPIGFRQPTVTVLPPTPPERGEPQRPIRVRVEIEIVERRQPSPRGHNFWAWVVFFLLLALAAHAQSTDWRKL
jgi:hypothetical protein